METMVSSVKCAEGEPALLLSGWRGERKEVAAQGRYAWGQCSLAPQQIARGLGRGDAGVAERFELAGKREGE
jgi:hypothetical protein